MLLVLPLLSMQNYLNNSVFIMTLYNTGKVYRTYSVMTETAVAWGVKNWGILYDIEQQAFKKYEWVMQYNYEE